MNRVRTELEFVTFASNCQTVANYVIRPIFPEEQRLVEHSVKRHHDANGQRISMCHGEPVDNCAAYTEQHLLPFISNPVVKNSSMHYCMALRRLGVILIAFRRSCPVSSHSSISIFLAALFPSRVLSCGSVGCRLLAAWLAQC